MNRFLILLVMVPFLVFSQEGSGRKNDELIIKGSIAGQIEPVKHIYAYFLDGFKSGLDSSAVVNGKYEFKSPIGTTSLVTLYLKRPGDVDALKGKNMLVFLTEPATVIVSSLDSFSNAKVSGSKANLEFIRLEGHRDRYSKQMQPLFAKILSKEKDNDTTGVKALQKDIDSLREVVADIYIRHIGANPGSMIIPYALSSYLNMHGNLSGEEIAGVTKIYLSLSAREQASHFGKKIKKKIESFAVQIGMQAPLFSQSDTLGNPVSLESFRGKYVLLDFWASWCGPCRKENPALVKIYNRYKQKGFTILSISLDRPGEKAKWLNAINHDSLSWTHVSDLRFWDNSVARLYKISEIPQNFLIDPSGKIIAKGLHGQKLEKKLIELLEPVKVISKQSPSAIKINLKELVSDSVPFFPVMNFIREEVNTFQVSFPSIDSVQLKSIKINDRPGGKIFFLQGHQDDQPVFVFDSNGDGDFLNEKVYRVEVGSGFVAVRRRQGDTIMAEVFPCKH